MASMYYMSGYGVSLSNIFTLLKEEFQDLSAYDLVEEMCAIEKENMLICSFSGEEDYVYIPDISPYVQSPFKSINEIDTYFYDKFKPFLMEHVDYDQFTSKLDDVFDWEYC